MSQSDDALVGLIEKEFNTLRGRILGLIESWNLPLAQESGAKSTFKGLSYDSQARIIDLVSETGLRQAIRDAQEAKAEIQRCIGFLTAGAKLADDAERARIAYALQFLDDRSTEISGDLKDLHHLASVQARIGGRNAS